MILRALLCALSFAGAVSATAHAQLKGDREAVALAEKMIDRLGGAEIWSESKTLYLEYSGWRANPAQPVDERAWRSLSTPDQRISFDGRNAEVVFNLNNEASWLEFSDHEPRRFNAEEHTENLAFWNYDFYTIIANLARGDKRLRLEFEAPQTIRIKGPDRADWGWFEIDATGQPIRWGAMSGDEALEYVYGPVRAFGNINFPAWGAATDGFWRFEYKIVDLRREAFVLNAKAPEPKE